MVAVVDFSCSNENNRCGEGSSTTALNNNNNNNNNKNIAEML
jgi:hypothetical protein